MEILEPILTANNDTFELLLKEISRPSDLIIKNIWQSYYVEYKMYDEQDIERFINITKKYYFKMAELFDYLWLNTFNMEWDCLKQLPIIII